MHGLVSSVAGHSWKASVPIACVGTCPVNTIIGNRQIYASSMGEGKTAIEKQRKGAATDEIKKLSEQILSELN